MIHTNPQTILHITSNLNTLIDAPPQTKSEAVLIAALSELKVENENLKHCLIELQATNILNETYCNKLRMQLAGKEEKATRKGEKRGKLMGDGLPHMLTDDEFYERVVEFTEWQC
ncbi:hypothetical protein FA15DRAFT_593413 [Coprinopsis marcescibilis]|uniref:Uncharacterized protein n=1 Tax=Coprinopsis marcescibilis TaxID=230819 RepID=A0A5C3KU88_COPMA|nr:hypothetical protein FA15DRAFT_593413 [Coprinopsis marcescibilis]